MQKSGIFSRFFASNSVGEKVTEMRCSKVYKKLDAYLDGEITDAGESLSMEKHLSDCEYCQAFYRTLNLSRLYLRKLKASPHRDFNPDWEEIFSVPPVQPAMVAVKAVAVVLVAGIAVSAFYFTQIRRPLPEIVQRPAVPIYEDSALVKERKPDSSDKSISVLPEGEETAFDTDCPTLVRISEAAWVSIEGRARLYRYGDSLRIDLSRGELYFVSDASFPLKKIVNVAEFQITSPATEFFIDAGEGRIDIQLLKGELLAKYTKGKRLAAVRLSDGEALTAAGAHGVRNIRTYKLSQPRKAALAVQIERIKETGGWFDTHPKEDYFESGEVRIEYWKEG